MADSTEAKISGSTTCPYCGAPSAGSYATVQERDEAGPSKILYKCNGCGRFYTAKRVISWHVRKE
jgi:DNA-directed RNA polymerase subunit M/transcription elongation factor TFIIS